MAYTEGNVDCFPRSGLEPIWHMLSQIREFAAVRFPEVHG